MSKARAYAALKPADHLQPFQFERRSVGEDDVLIRIHYCGICHTDLHMVNNDWGMSQYPMVPGHEIIGKVEAVGSKVKRFSIGDWVGVGCMVDSCRTCDACIEGEEQFCQQGMTMTYGGQDLKSPGQITQGGYSDHIVVDQHFVVNIPKNLSMSSVAPLLCAGITTYSPLKYWQVQPGQLVGVIGLGGLGHLAIKFAKAMGAKVCMVTSTRSKRDDAKRLGADYVIDPNRDDEMLEYSNQFDLLLNTIPVAHEINRYLPLLKRNKTMVLVGGTEVDMHSINLVFGRKQVAGSLIGGMHETQEMLVFCGKHQIHPDIELINVAEINTAYQRLASGDVKYRFVIDMMSITADKVSD